VRDAEAEACGTGERVSAEDDPGEVEVKPTCSKLRRIELGKWASLAHHKKRPAKEEV